MSDILGTLVTTEVIAWVAMAVSAAIGIRVVTRFTRDHAALGKRLLHADRQLETLRDHIAEKQGAIKELQAEVDVVRPTHDQLLTYSEELFEIQLVEDRREAAEVDEHDPKTRREANLWEG